MRITDRLKHSWNAFKNNDQLVTYDRGSSSSRPAHKNVTFFSTSSYVSSIYNRIALDVSMTGFKHVKVNPDNEDMTLLETGLNNCLTTEANIDQTHIQFIHDLVYSMFDEGVVAVVPVDTTLNPEVTGSYDINSLRVGRIINWFPKHVEVELYNENSGHKERVTLEKRNVAIIENPLYAVINDTNSTLKRLLRKLNELDNSDNSPGRLDLLISLPYTVKTESQRQMAEKRIKEIEAQLSLGRNGIAYIDGIEKAMQLNRPVNDQLPEEIQALNQEFHNQLGLTKKIFDGTASESEQRTYYNRAIDPIVDNILAEFNRKFITKTARTQGHKIVSYRDMFKTVPIEILVNLGDAFRRNSIASSNELRRIIGLPPSNDPRADELFNPNIADKNQNQTPSASDSTKIRLPKREEEEEIESGTE